MYMKDYFLESSRQKNNKYSTQIPIYSLNEDLANK